MTVASPAGTTAANHASTKHTGAPPASVTLRAPIDDRKLRLLCLHGYLQNAEVFRSRIGSLRKALKSRAEFFFVDAPYPVEAEAAEEGAAADGGSGAAQGRSWWQWSDLEAGTRPSRAAQYTGWQASQAAILAALEQHAPIDGILGFSQGATAAALFLAHAQDQQQQQHEKQQQDEQQAPAGQQQTEQRQQLLLLQDLRFAVVIAGFLPRDAAYAATLQRGRPTLPCLHVHGAGDELVPEDRSRALWDCFDPGCVQVYRHPGAHMVPTCSGEFKKVLAGLLDDVKAGRLCEQQAMRPLWQEHEPQQAAAAAASEVQEAAAVAAAAAPAATSS